MSAIEVNVFSKIKPSKTSGSISAAYAATAPPKLLPMAKTGAPVSYLYEARYDIIICASYFIELSLGKPAWSMLSE